MGVYMSPELCSGQPYDRGCDTWALGCVLYEMMTLSPPWVDQLPPKAGMLPLMRLICTGSLNFEQCRRHYSDELCQVLASLLSKQPRLRPSLRQVMQMLIIKSTLAELHAGKTPPVTPPATSPEVSPRSGNAEEEESSATGDPPAELPPPVHPVAPLPPPPMSGAAAAAKHLDIDRALGEAAARRNPFDARSPALCGFAVPYVRAHGAQGHAAAMVLQRSFQRRRPGAAAVHAVRAPMQRRPAGLPSRPPPRPLWA